MFLPLCLPGIPTTNSWQQTNVQICKSQLQMFPHRNSWQKSGLGSHKSDWPNGGTVWTNPCAAENNAVDASNLPQAKIVVFCCKISPLSTPPPPLGLKLASEFPSVVPANNVSIPIYCLHLNPTTLVDTRRDAILVNVTDSSNYMNSRRQIWIIAINILNGGQIFSFPRGPNINLAPAIDLRFNFCQRVELLSQSDPFSLLCHGSPSQQVPELFCLISWIRNTSSLLWS